MAEFYYILLHCLSVEEKWGFWNAEFIQITYQCMYFENLFLYTCLSYFCYFHFKLGNVRLYPPHMQFYDLSFGVFFSILVIFAWTLIVLKNLCHFSKSYVKISSYVHKIDNDIFKKFYLWKLSSLFLMYALIMILLAIHTLKMLITLLQESPPPIILYSNTFHIHFWEDKVKWQVYLTIYCSYDTKVILIFWG